jgi:hypothetical protein
MEWKKLENERPTENKKFYIVAYANPYYTDSGLTLEKVFFDNGKFDNEVSGANYIAFWLDGLEMPYLSIEERNKLVK